MLKEFNFDKYQLYNGKYYFISALTQKELFSCSFHLVRNMENYSLFWSPCAHKVYDSQHESNA